MSLHRARTFDVDSRNRRFGPQRGIVAARFALLLVLAIPGGACGNGSAREEGAPASTAVGEEKAAQPIVPSSEALYEKWGCPICHGKDGRGTANAPALTNLSSHWNIDTLAGYLLEPAKWRDSDPRIRKLVRQYPKLTMPPSKHPDAERRALATWLLRR